MTSATIRRQELVWYGGLAAMSLCAGLLVVQSQNAVAMSMLALFALLALAGVAVIASLPIEAVFIGWLFLAPIFQVAADTTSVGRGLTWVLNIAPALLFAVVTISRRRHVLRFTWVDWLPAAFVAYVMTSIALTSNILSENPTGSAKAIFTIVALGPLIYYFLTFGPGIDIAESKIIVTLVAAAFVQGVLAIIEFATSWSIWNNSTWLDSESGARASATLTNPGILGMFLGIGIVSVVAVRIWGGPARLRRWFWIVLAVCVPGLLATLTRGPILATAVAVVLLLLVGRARIVGFAVIAVSIIVLAIVMPEIQQTGVYQKRFSDKATVDTRVALQSVSLQLAEQKPLLGWGYGSFDRVKRESGLTVEGIRLAAVLENTSHNTYLTILVELGIVGGILFAVPFLILILRAFRQRPPPPGKRWLLATALGSLVVIYLTASTLDLRFFSLAQVLPFVMLAFLRRLTAAPPGTARIAN